MGIKRMFVFAAIVLFVWGTKAQANVNQIKAYKEAYPDAKLKCVDCHVDALPKKDEGKHGWNDYGKKVKEINPKPTAETYKKAGKIEDSKDKKADKK